MDREVWCITWCWLLPIWDQTKQRKDENEANREKEVTNGLVAFDAVGETARYKRCSLWYPGPESRTLHPGRRIHTMNMKHGCLLNGPDLGHRQGF